MVSLIIFILWTFLQYFFNERGNRWRIGETGQLAEFMEYSRYLQDLPSQGTQTTLTQETKKVWTLQPKPSQRSSLRSSTGKVQQCSLTQWLHNQTSCTCAALQWQRSSTEEQWAVAAAAGRLRSISLVCVLHNTITLHLTAVKSRSTVKTLQNRHSLHKVERLVAIPKVSWNFIMTHLVGIDKGPVMDWTNDSGLDEWYRKWKIWVEVLFKGPLNGVMEGVKCNYVIYWSGDHGMDLVDKWTAEAKIHDGNKDTLNTYWTHFGEYIHPQTNQLIAVVELKWLFQGTLCLEDFHTRPLRLVTQAGYTGDAKNQVLRDTIISGLASDKIRAKIVKEGHAVTLNWVMEIARLEVSTQQHVERMQETAKVNYIQYGKSTKGKKGKKPQSGAGAGGHRGSKPSGKGKKSPFLPDTCYRCGKGRHQKTQDCKAVDATCRGCGKKDTLRRFASRGNAPYTL